MGVTNPKIEVDHNPDQSGLNNQKHNLRLVTRQQNMSNQKLSVKNTSGYKGVVWCKPLQKWQAHIKVNYKTKHLGYFTDVLDAARAYNQAASKLFGEFAQINKI